MGGIHIVEQREISRAIARIQSGEMRIKIDGTTFSVRNFTAVQKYIAEDLYWDVYDKAKDEDVMDEKELAAFLKEKNLWNDEEQKELENCDREIDSQKIALFQKKFRSEERRLIRENLKRLKIKQGKLYDKKHKYDGMTCDTVAANARYRFLIGCSVFVGDKPFWAGEDDWKIPDPNMDKIIFAVNKNTLNNEEIRAVTKSDRWQHEWNMQKQCDTKIFNNTSPANLTEEQKLIVNWSASYDAIRSHPDNLEDEVIMEDDMIDGWMLIKRQERERNQVKNLGETFTTNEKIKNAGEVFIMANTKEDANKIQMINSDSIRAGLQDKFAIIKERGEIAEQDFPEIKRDLEMRSNAEHRERVKKMKSNQ